MTKEETLYTEIGQAMKSAEQSQMFGKPCFKINGKAFVSYFDGCMVFKLKGDAHAEALDLAGSVLFDPSGKNRPMREWVQVPHKHHALWPALAKSAFSYVKSATKG